MGYIIIFAHYWGAESWSRLLFVNPREQLSLLLLLPSISTTTEESLLEIQEACICDESSLSKLINSFDYPGKNNSH